MVIKELYLNSMPADYILISQIEAALTKQICSGFESNSLCLAESNGSSFSHQKPLPNHKEENQSLHV